MKIKIIGIIILILLILVLLSVIITLNNNNNDFKNNNLENSIFSEIKINNNPKLKETKYLDNLEINNIKLTTSTNGSQISANIKNNSEETLGNFSIKIILLDENDNEVNDLVGYISEIQPGNTINLNVSTTIDILNIYDVKFTRL